MRDLSKAIKASMKYELFSVIDIQQTVNFICESFSVIPITIDPDSPWIEFHSSRTHRLAILMHKYYRLAFVLSKLIFLNPDFHIEYTNDFNAPEWYIDDIDIFNNDFRHIHWNEPESVVNPNRFNLMDMKFATE